MGWKPHGASWGQARTWGEQGLPSWEARGTGEGKWEGEGKGAPPRSPLLTPVVALTHRDVGMVPCVGAAWPAPASEPISTRFSPTIPLLPTLSRYCEHPPETAEHHFDLVCYHYKHTARSSSNSLLQSRAPALLRSRWEAVPAAQGLSGCVAQGDHGGPGHLQVGTARREVLGGHGSPIPRCPV